MYCIETSKLSYCFSNKEKVLDEINLQVPEGSIYGFLGPNGAGKTTTLRLILGLLKKQKGEIQVFGKSLDANRTEILARLGSLIESPSLYSHLNATENLEVMRRIYGCAPERIAEVLQKVGLSDTGKKKAGAFSLGMKQRLSIAMALLPDPALLILDEPTNGLDPNGIQEMRALLRKLNQEEKMTILVSSHLLSEVEKVVSHVGIIHKGKMMFQGTLAELMSKQEESSFIHLDTSNNGKALGLLNESGIAARAANKYIQVPALPKEQIARVNKQLCAAGLDVYEISWVKNDLETIFMDITNKNTSTL
jgi:ABC-type multidrug transport system ATPase subunit